MKKLYLQKLCDELDYITTQLDGENDWQEQIISVINNHMKLSHKHFQSDSTAFQEFLDDMQEFTESMNEITATHRNRGV